MATGEKPYAPPAVRVTMPASKSLELRSRSRYRWQLGLQRGLPRPWGSVSSLARDFDRVIGAPRGEQLQPLRRRGAWFCRVDQQHLAGFGGDGEFLLRERHLADDRVVEPLGARAVSAHIVRSPQASEGVAAGREFAHEVLQSLVVPPIAPLSSLA
ncbi:hypothetical protein GCM10009777_11020 [Microbacterium pumilum]|uniref:Uncharacterized protein n=1 Tax=Microbacterium pumilum TaxID=344165 RepID=A0ABP5DFY0_9MICO